MEKNAQVYDFQDYRSFLASVLQSRKKRLSRYSIGAWARRLDLNSSSTLIMILKGTRNPGPELIQKLVKDLKLQGSEEKYFRDLVQLAKTRKDEYARQTLLEKLIRKNPMRTFRPLSADLFRVFSSWIPGAIRELADLPGFRSDPDWIQQRLRFKATKPEIIQATSSLLAVGLLKQDGKGSLAYTEPVQSVYDISHESKKQLHESFLEVSKEAVRSVAPSEREISGMTFTMRAADLPLLKEKIRELLEAAPQISTSDQDTVYHLEVACVPLTKKEGI